ncbi:MAG TPA: CDP-alcohol phosphatidyltransferase family protein [Gemmatimonadaceae bacterium]|nr:CDP-alcohol phosphatidyltransferase family protein [Gemmatimonadaceae bacterium]
MTASPRRHLRTREQRWPRALASALGNAGVRPNAISVLSIVVAAVAGFALWESGNIGGSWPLLVTAAIAIQLRLLCNMLDGLLAVEGGFKSKLGDLYNEIPDRIADALILIGAGYAVRSLPYGEVVGWSAALLAVMTAYLRLLAGSLGARQLFIGPMAKQHRMFAMTLGCLAAAIEHSRAGTVRALWLALAVVVAGSIITLVRRLMRLVGELESR